MDFLPWLDSQAPTWGMRSATYGLNPVTFNAVFTPLSPMFSLYRCTGFRAF
ncbi:hypothetical protein NKDENANG_00058 [Candidatus Entotheonellaceae bacterium PAL068K]